MMSIGGWHNIHGWLMVYFGCCYLATLLVEIVFQLGCVSLIFTEALLGITESFFSHSPGNKFIVTIVFHSIHWSLQGEGRMYQKYGFMMQNFSSILLNPFLAKLFCLGFLCSFRRFLICFWGLVLFGLLVGVLSFVPVVWLASCLPLAFRVSGSA